ncbi:hypothetical protein [Marinomonas epiphytica]
MKNSNYCMVWYTAQGCEVLPARQSPKNYASAQEASISAPDLEELATWQSQLSLTDIPSQSRVVVVIPNAWVSSSKHRLEYDLSSMVAPIAALSFAVESTFLAAENLAFSYQQYHTKNDGNMMQVDACDNQLRRQLCLPFWRHKSPVTLLSYNQYCLGLKQAKPLKWWRLNALQPYKPEQKRVRDYRSKWCVFALVICALQLFLWVGKVGLTREAPRQQIVKASANDINESPSLVQNALLLSQSLPTSSRVRAVEVTAQSASIFASMPTQDLAHFQQQQAKSKATGDWHVRVLGNQPPLGSNTEVRDVLITASAP